MLTALVASIILAMSADAALAHQPRCLKGLRPALEKGGFSGSVDCQKDQLAIRHVGRVRKHGRTFEVYSNRYRLKPPCSECAIRGGQRIIFMERGRYVGQYKSDFVKVTIRSGNLVLVPINPKSGRPVNVVFTRDGPPKRLWVDNEVVQLFK